MKRACLLICCLMMANHAFGETIAAGNDPLNGTVHMDIIGPMPPEPEQLPIEPKSLSPLDVIDAVEKKNLDVLQARVMVEKAQWERNGAVSRLLPSVGLDFNVEKVTGSTVILNQRPLSVQRVTQRPRVTFGYQFSTGLTPVWEIGRSQLAVNRSKLGNTRILQQSLSEALTQYYNWLYYASASETARETLREAMARKEYDQARFQSGFGTQLDVEQSTVNELEQRSEVLMVENEKITAGIHLQSLLNDTPGLGLAAPAEGLRPAYLYNPAGQSLESLYAIASAKRNDLKELNLAIKEAKTSLATAISSVMPVINVNGYMANIGPEKGQYARSFQRGVTLSWDAANYMGLEKLSQIQLERLKIKDAIIQKEKSLQTIYRSLAKAYYDWQLAKSQMETMHQKISSAKDAFEIAQARQQLGLGIHLDVVLAQTQLGKARQDYLKAVMKYNISQIQLLLETGQLTLEGLRLAYQSEPPSGKQPRVAQNSQ